MADGSVRAVVERVVPQGRHGPYMVTRSDGEARLNITVSLDKTVWQEQTLPEPGTYVILSQLSKKRAGWRAGSARLLQLSDEI